MNRRELFGKLLGVGAIAITTCAIEASSDGSYNGPPGGSRGSKLVAVISRPFSTASDPVGLLNLRQIPQFVAYLRIQVHPGQHGKVVLASSSIYNSWNHFADAGFAELWPNYDGSTDNGRSDTWIMQDVNWQNTINLADIYVYTEIWGETPLVTAYQLV
ncbi:MAG TPA: hypothetical protein VK335_04905 [Bryobacteraceae bacterium]|nr:hypothetical protein [Bryobacteraceae bacterium]